MLVENRRSREEEKKEVLIGVYSRQFSHAVGIDELNDMKMTKL